jgi:hypothetical protein
MNNIYEHINGNNYDSIYKLLFAMIFLFGSIFLHGTLFSIIYSDENDELLTCKFEERVQEQVKQPVHIPYEEKYLTKVRNMVNEYVFTDEELVLQEQKLEELKKEENSKQLEATYSLNEKIEELTIKLREINDEYDAKKDSNKDETLVKKLYESIQNEINLHKKQLLELQENAINIDDLKEKTQQYIIDEQLKKFKTKYIIEHTPLGNVLMFYNHDKLAFEYYSDLTIPYRYLDTVSRKYVLTYNYRPLYIDMEEELKECEKRLQEKEKQMKQQMELQENDKLKAKPKDVFAKFKSYNKEAGTGRVNTAPPPKNSIPQNRIMNANLKDNEKMILKERANRYSYQGKFLNFNILQKIDKKVIDKKYALTFADFKKMNKLENKN